MKHLLVLILSAFSLSVSAQDCTPVTLPELENLLNFEKGALRFVVTSMGFTYTGSEMRKGEGADSIINSTYTLYFKKCMVAIPDSQSLTLNIHTDGYGYFVYNTPNEKDYLAMEAAIKKKAKKAKDTYYNYYTDEYMYLMSKPWNTSYRHIYSIAVAPITNK